jgi:hypothetical protein
VAKPRIEITPSQAQYKQLCRDLKKLRKLGAPSHTAAILEAVHAAAEGNMLGRDPGTAGRRQSSPGTATGGPAADAGQP